MFKIRKDKDYRKNLRSALQIVGSKLFTEAFNYADETDFSEDFHEIKDIVLIDTVNPDEKYTIEVKITRKVRGERE